MPDSPGITMSSTTTSNCRSAGQLQGLLAVRGLLHLKAAAQ